MKRWSALLFMSLLMGGTVLLSGKAQGQVILDQNSGRDPYCEVNPSAAQCAGTAISCEVNPAADACRGTVSACANDPSAPECSDSKIFCQRNPAADRCQLAAQAAAVARQSATPQPTPNSGGPTGAGP